MVAKARQKIVRSSIIMQKNPSSLLMLAATSVVAASFVAVPAPAQDLVKPLDIKTLRPAPKPQVKTSLFVAPVRESVPVPVKRTLPNGLTLLVLENHAAPVVAVRAYVKTGSIYEGEHLGSGISHLFEHVLGEGTKTRSKQQMDDEVQAIGGQSNAYTSYDVTAYHMTTASQYFERALDLLSDQLQNATFPAKEVGVQQGVIHNEMNMGEDDPDRTLYKAFYETAFTEHPVRYPVIGYRETFDKLTPQDIVNYYKTHYTPNNTVISIAGDVDAMRAVMLAEKLFAGWKRGVPKRPAISSEARQTARRRAVIEKEIGQSYLMMGWHTIPLQHPDLYALDVLAQIFGGGDSSRLVRVLREKENLVSSVSAWSSTPNYNAGVFAVRAEMPPQNQAKAGAAIWKEAAKLWTEKVTPEELSTAKRQIEAAFIFSNQDVEEQAEQIAYDELGTGDPSFSRSYVARIKAVTADQVQSAAKRYITREGMTTALVVPKGQGESIIQAAPRAAAKAPELVTLPNGLRLIIRENHAARAVSIVAQGLGGARLEPGFKPGLANLAGEMLSRGTRKRSYQEISTLVDSLGGSFGSSSGYNSWSVDSQWLAKDWKTGLQLVAEAIMQPAFKDDDLTRVKQQVLAGIQQQTDDPESAGSLLLRRTFFGNHPYGRSPLGTSSSVQTIKAQDLAKFWDSIAQPRSVVLAVYGDVNAGEVKRAVQEQFKDFNRSTKPLLAPSPASELTQFTAQEVRKPGLAQAVLFYGYPGIDVKGEDRYAIDVLDAALSGANLPGGRLHARLRDNQLVYYVHAYDSPGLNSGMFVIYAGSTKDKAEEVKKIIGEEVQKVRDADISAEELERAKSMAISASAIANQGNTAQAKTAVGDELFGLGYRNNSEYAARINAISIDDVRRVAQKYLRTDNSAFAVVLPE